MKTGPHAFVSQGEWEWDEEGGTLIPTQGPRPLLENTGLTQTPGTWRHCGGRAGPGLCSLPPPQASQAQEERREGLAVFAEYTSARILEMLVE